MSLQPLPQAILTASKLRQQAKELILLAEELEASAPRHAFPRTHSAQANDIIGEVIKRDRNQPRKPRGSKP